MSEIRPVRGTRDFYPDLMAFQTWLYGQIRAVSEAFGYQEFNAPILEPLELYAAKSGDELVKEQAFVFPDRNQELVTLRPELTPSLARMVAARAKSLSRPIRWWSYGPFWRYERPQKGRSREFFQWNIDLLGEKSPEIDAEIAAIGAFFFQSIGLEPTMVRILVNNRQLVEKKLNAIGIPSSKRLDVFRVIDRRERMRESEWESFAKAEGLTDEQVRALQALMEDNEAWKASDELPPFFEALESLGASAYCTYDPTVIRGLDYYTGTVFEARDFSGEFRAILGGGRYDNLVADVGGDSLPAVGFAMGDVVLGLVLESCGVYPELRPNPAEALVVTFDSSTIQEALRLAAEVRAAQVRVEWYPKQDRLSKQLRYADSQGIPLVLILGPDELENETVTVKELETGNQMTLPRAEAAERVRRLLDQIG